MFTGRSLLHSFCLRSSCIRQLQTSPRCNSRSIQDIRKELQTTLGATSAWRKNEETRRILADSMVKQQDQLTPRRMQDSYCEAVVHLTDEKIKDSYRGLKDHIRFGLLLENLDTFAVYISYLHNDPSSFNTGVSPYSIVTAMVDEIQICDYYNFTVNDDIHMHGHVSWVGKSSIEVKMWMTQNNKPMINAKFVMVARDPCNKSAVVHPLQLDNKKDQLIFEKGVKSKVERLKQAEYSLLKHPPNEGERKIIHDLFMQTLDTKTMSFRSRKLPENCTWMEDTKMKTSIICFPQKRNIHNKIFGGFIMRKGFEQAWANACLFSSTFPSVIAVDDILFRSPVSIGSLLLMSSQVCYSQDKQFHIRVHAEVADPTTGSMTTCNTFNFSFESDRNVKTVMPKTYGESMLYLDGRRHYSETKPNP